MKLQVLETAQTSGGGVAGQLAELRKSFAALRAGSVQRQQLERLLQSKLDRHEVASIAQALAGDPAALDVDPAVAAKLQVSAYRCLACDRPMRSLGKGERAQRDGKTIDIPLALSMRHGGGDGGGGDASTLATERSAKRAKGGFGGKPGLKAASKTSGSGGGVGGGGGGGGPASVGGSTLSATQVGRVSHDLRLEARG